MVILQDAVGTFVNIPDYLLLPEDGPQETQYTEEERKTVDEELVNLRDKIRKNTYHKASLENELKTQKEIENSYLEIENLKKIAKNCEYERSKFQKIEENFQNSRKLCKRVRELFDIEENSFGS